MDRSDIPTSSAVLGLGPMVPFVAAAVGAWVLPARWTALASPLAVIWGAIILAFVAGVRRGYAFGNGQASTPTAIRDMMVYFMPSGVALLLAAVGQVDGALVLLLTAYLGVIVLDRRAALTGNAPAHFARLRPPQMAVAALSLIAVLLR